MREESEEALANQHEKMLLEKQREQEELQKKMKDESSKRMFLEAAELQEIQRLEKEKWENDKKEKERKEKEMAAKNGGKGTAPKKGFWSFASPFKNSNNSTTKPSTSDDPCENVSEVELRELNSALSLMSTYREH